MRSPRPDPTALVSSYPSICTFRDHIVRRLSELGPAKEPVIILAVDGVPLDLGGEVWASGETTPLRSVFPTTTATAWLSSLTGATVSEHGVPGVSFRDPPAPPIPNLFAYDGDLSVPDRGSLFDDARRLGYLPVVVLGDLGPLECSWRDALTRDAVTVAGTTFFNEPVARPDRAAEAVHDCIEAVLAGAGADPILIWCFVDADLYIHRHGYDAALIATVRWLGDLAQHHRCKGRMVIGYSDHGLVPTVPDPDLEGALRGLGVEVGGAGRTRWLYCDGATPTELLALARQRLQGDLTVARRDRFFASGSQAYRRVGEVVVIAEGESFISSGGTAYDHGSLQPTEVEVPLTEWLP